MIKLKTKKDLEFLRKSGAILAQVLQSLAGEAKEGVPLSYLEMKARALISAAGATPAFLGYTPEGAREAYPAAICASVNEEVVHGLPREYKLRSGDVLKIDLGVNYKGYITDSATTVTIGKVPRKIFDLIHATEDSLKDAIAVCKEGNRLGDIGYAIEKRISKAKFSIVQGLTGHGTGFKLHEDPTVWNFGRKGEGMILKEGLVIAIEPMAVTGKGMAFERHDGTFVTQDGSIAAHFEHTIYITKTGCEVLTRL
jgi:methionyl aminopeptidase